MSNSSDPARPGFDRKMTREEINTHLVRKFEGPIRLIRTPEELAQACDELEQQTVLGFDTETKPAFHKGQSFAPTVLQLAGHEVAYIIQLKHLGLPERLRALLANPAIVKAGVSLDYDIGELRKIKEFQAGGFIDLGVVAKKSGLKNHGLRGLAAVLLGFRISKGAQRSNWAQDELTSVQIDYAATDAWVGRELYLHMAEKGYLPGYSAEEGVGAVAVALPSASPS